MSQQNPSPSDKCVGCGHPRTFHFGGMCHFGCSYLHKFMGVHEPTCKQIDGDGGCASFVEHPTHADAVRS